MEIESIIYNLKELSKKKLQSGNFEPKMYFIIQYEGEPKPVYFPVPVSSFFTKGLALREMIPKYAAMAWLKKLCTTNRVMQLLGVVVVSDAWFGIRKTGKDPRSLTQEEIKKLRGESLEHDPNAKDALMMFVGLPDQHKLIYAVYEKRENKIIFTNDEIDGGEVLSGWIKELYPSDLTEAKKLMTHMIHWLAGKPLN